MVNRSSLLFIHHYIYTQPLYDECINRGFNVTNYASAWDDVPQEMMGSYMPKESDIDAIRKRIRERGG